MKSSKSQPQSASPVRRRGVLLGGSAVALAGVAAAVASRSSEAEIAEARVQARQQDAADGYRLTDHVRRYYETIRV